ncbi:MAG: DNA repair protein RecN [Acidobacteriota bacterium]
MLTDLHIRNLAVVESASIELERGFNVLSGETGAGKSIVVDSLALLSGVRASNDQIRTGAEALTVTGVFRPAGDAWRLALERAGLEAEGDEVVVRREISRAGRNRVYLDDRPVTLKLLVDLAPELLRIHGQREELGLVDPELQRTWLDRCGGEEGEVKLRAVGSAYRAWRELMDRVERLRGDARAREERLDLLRFQLAEIDDVAPTEGEEDALRAEREVLRHAEAIRDGLASASTLLFEGDDAARDAVARARHAVQEIAGWEPGAAEWAAELEDLSIRLGEIEPALSRRLDEVESDPARLDVVETRLATLERLFQKFGASSAELLATRERLAQEIEELDAGSQRRSELDAELTQAANSYAVVAIDLSTARRRWARELERRVTADLAELALGRAIFEVRLEPRRRPGGALIVAGEPVDPGPLGVDQVTYQFSPNPGEETRPLARVASGGELSRLYLAVQLAALDEKADGRGTTLVFDEVDAGISGAEAAVLGRKLRRLGRGGQVLAVTHLPQVASCADRHFKVRKQVEDGRTRTAVEALEDGGRVEEVARMLAGSEVTDLSLSHARELIGSADD